MLREKGAILAALWEGTRLRPAHAATKPCALSSAGLVHIRARVGWRLREHFKKVKKLHVRARLWRACFLLTGCTSWTLCNFCVLCRDFILMGGSHQGGQQKLELLSEAGKERRRRERGKPNWF